MVACKVSKLLLLKVDILTGSPLLAVSIINPLKKAFKNILCMGSTEVLFKVKGSTTAKSLRTSVLGHSSLAAADID